MKNKKKTNTSIHADRPQDYTQDDKLAFGAAGADIRQPLRNTLQRYCFLALLIAICVGGLMMLIGFRPIGKGLILGTLFSVLNFILMATALPLRVGFGRGKSFLFSLGSVYLRYALLAIPLVLAFNQDVIAVSTVAVGLFMVQITIMGDQLWHRLRNFVEVNC